MHRTFYAYKMNLNDFCLYGAIHKIPIYHKNGFTEERQLNTVISDNGERIQIKLRDVSDCCFNFTENISIQEFEKIRITQTLDINYNEFKSNIIEMFHQFQTGEIYLKGDLLDKKCLFTFYTKSKIKNIIFLILELHLTDQSAIISEMYLEMSEVKDTNKRLQKQLSMSKKHVQEKELELENLEITKNIIMSQYCKCFKQVDELFSTKINHVQNLVFNKISAFKTQIINLQKKVELIKKENDSKSDINKQIMLNFKDLQLKLIDNEDILHKLKKENSSLIILRANLERNIAELKRTVEDLRNINNKMEVKNNELENDLKKFSIIVTQKEDKISELSKDLVQANNMLVGFNQQCDKKSQKVEDLQNALFTKEGLLNEQKLHMNHILKSFEDYKKKFNNDSFHELKSNLAICNRKNEELLEDIRKLNKINALLSQRVGQGYLHI